MQGSLVVTLLVLAAGTAAASELREIEIDEEGGRYTMHSVVWFDVPLDNAYNVFLDWDLSEQFSSVVVEARNTGSDASGDRGFYTRNRACVLFFCKEVERFGTIEYEPGVWIRATTDPEKSDFEVSNEVWVFEPEGVGTRITYRLEMDPKFWIPPLIGPYVLKKKMREDGVRALDRIEAIAKDWKADAR